MMTPRQTWDDLHQKLEDLDEECDGDGVAGRLYGLANRALALAKPFAKPEVPHLKMAGEPGEVKCMRCGVTRNLWADGDGDKILSSLLVEEFTARSEAFQDEHANCLPWLDIRDDLLYQIRSYVISEGPLATVNRLIITLKGIINDAKENRL